MCQSNFKVSNIENTVKGIKHGVFVMSCVTSLSQAVCQETSVEHRLATCNNYGTIHFSLTNTLDLINVDKLQVLYFNYPLSNITPFHLKPGD